jgi:hypothetical protein
MGLARRDALRRAGHAVTTPTLAGLGERRHIGRDADLDTHIQDVVAHVEMEGVDNITLVAWSYGPHLPPACCPEFMLRPKR